MVSLCLLLLDFAPGYRVSMTIMSPDTPPNARHTPPNPRIRSLNSRRLLLNNGLASPITRLNFHPKVSKLYTLFVTDLARY